MFLSSRAILFRPLSNLLRGRPYDFDGGVGRKILIIHKSDSECLNPLISFIQSQRDPDYLFSKKLELDNICMTPPPPQRLHGRTLREMIQIGVYSLPISRVKPT